MTKLLNKNILQPSILAIVACLVVYWALYSVFGHHERLRPDRR